MNHLWVGWLRLISFINLILGLIGSTLVFKYLSGWKSVSVSIAIIIESLTIFIFLNVVCLAVNYLADIKHYNSYIFEEMKKSKN